MESVGSEPLIFPKGIRFPRRNELPRGNEDAFARIAQARIVTGFTRIDKDGPGYSSYFEVNVHAPKIFAVFRDLAHSLLPTVAAPIIGVKDTLPVFGPYTNREAALEVFEQHIHALENDGFLEFGIIFGYENTVEEIFVKHSKYFQIWSNQPDIVAAVLVRNNIPHVAELEFIDEYPMVSKSLGPGGSAIWPIVFEAIEQAFEDLPRR